jgi:DNA transformation protein
VSSQQKTVDYIVEQSAGAGTMTAKKMFGEYGLYCDGKIVALICDDQLFIKPTEPKKAKKG